MAKLRRVTWGQGSSSVLLFPKQGQLDWTAWGSTATEITVLLLVVVVVVAVCLSVCLSVCLFGC